MEDNRFLLRKAEITDVEKVFELYKRVARDKMGLARNETEITRKYVRHFILKSMQNGVHFVLVDLQNDKKIIGDIHCYKLEPKVFQHILSELTIAIDQEYQGKGFGRKLFQALLDFVSSNRPDVARIELITRESNVGALKLYEHLGFKKEGRLEKRISSGLNSYEADIPMAWFNLNFNS